MMMDSQRSLEGESDDMHDIFALLLCISIQGIYSRNHRI
jgi:hypothetical protein